MCYVYFSSGTAAAHAIDINHLLLSSLLRIFLKSTINQQLKIK